MSGTDSTGAGGKVDIGHVLARASANGHDLESLVRPLLEALAKLAGLDSTYLAVFDWERREQEVRYVHSAGDIQVIETTRMALPAGLSSEALLGVTRSAEQLPASHPDSLVARRLGLKSYVSVPISVAKHQLFGMLCGASRESRPISEQIVSVMEFFAQIIADHVTRTSVAATERRADLAEERLRARARFLATAEHMLKLPLTIMTGTPQALLDHWEDMSEETRIELLTTMVRNAERLHRQIDELLLEARADIQAREQMPMRVELAPLAQMIVTALASATPTHRIVADATPGAVAWADPSSLYQVLGHLLDNAIKYSPDGGTITLRVTTDSGGIRIDVVDEGVGVPEDIDVFEPFQRGDPDDHAPTAGIGLGLHIVRNLVEATGGTIVARRNPGRGSTFSVHVPAATASRAGAAPTS